MQRMLEKEEKNDETIKTLMEQNQMLMQQLADKSNEKVTHAIAVHAPSCNPKNPLVAAKKVAYFSLTVFFAFFRLFSYPIAIRIKCAQ